MTYQHFYHCHYGVMNHSLLMPDVVALHAKLNEIQRNESHFALEVSFSVCINK